MWTAVAIVSLISGGIGIFLKLRNRRSSIRDKWEQAKWLIWIGELKERWRTWWSSLWGETITPPKPPKKKHPLRPWLDD